MTLMESKANDKFFLLVSEVEHKILNLWQYKYNQVKGYNYNYSTCYLLLNETS